MAVRLIVEREREIQAFESAGFFKVVGTFVGDAQKPFDAELNKQLKHEKEVEQVLEELKSASYTISSIEVKP